MAWLCFEHLQTMEEDFNIKIVSLTDERSYLDKLSDFWKLTIGGIIVASYVWGTLMKCIIYSFFTKSRRRSKPFSLKGRPWLTSQNLGTPRRHPFS